MSCFDVMTIHCGVVCYCCISISCMYYVHACCNCRNKQEVVFSCVVTINPAPPSNLITL